MKQQKDDELIFELKSEHLDQHFPGSLIVVTKFTIPSNSDCLLIHYSARLDDTNPPNLSTIVNLTNHTYFNLDGCAPAESQSDSKPTILEHEIYSKDAKAILEQNSDQVSTGRLIRLEDAEPAFEISKGFIKLRKGCENGLYDHSFAFETNPDKYTVTSNQSSNDSTGHNESNFTFEVISRQSNIKLTMRTDNFSCHMYTGPRESILNYPPFSAVCLEAQSFANSCNVPQWLNQCLVTSDKPYSKFISYSFEHLN